MRALILALLLPVVMLAQPPRGFLTWWDSPLAKELNLTADQQNQIRDILRDYRKELIDERAAVEKAEIDIQAAMEADTFDRKAANAALDKLVAARAGMTRSFTEMGFKLRTILTADQWKQVQQRARQGMRERGPGGRNQRQMQPNRGGMRRGMGSGGQGPGGPAPGGQGQGGQGPGGPPPLE
jgi:Spy/CpxP family protein refolding chaperone